MVNPLLILGGAAAATAAYFLLAPEEERSIVTQEQKGKPTPPELKTPTARALWKTQETVFLDWKKGGITAGQYDVRADTFTDVLLRKRAEASITPSEYRLLNKRSDEIFDLYQMISKRSK